jgi:outer membrane protein assembly factor BamB
MDKPHKGTSAVLNKVNTMKDLLHSHTKIKRPQMIKPKFKGLSIHFQRFPVFVMLLLMCLGSGFSKLAAALDTSSIYLPIVLAPFDTGSWPMVAANPQRTSWVSEQVSGNLNVVWYRPIEAYIPENVQIITANGMLYIATARGLYALRADNGEIVWRFDTQMPLGNSPTVVKGVIYIGGYDRKIHALNAFTGAHLWAFEEAQAGFSTNPLVVEGKVIAGNRDGYMYAIGAQGTANQGQLIWKYKTGNPDNPADPDDPGGPILLSAAYKNGVVYFAANDNHAYALRVNTTNPNGELIWRSAKLPGDGFQSYWPVIYQDKVIFSGAVGYRAGADPGTGSIIDPDGNPYESFDRLQKDDLFFDKPDNPIGPTVQLYEDWTHGKEVIDGSRITEYLENNPQTDPHLHKPWRRTYLVLNLSDGSEYTFDYDQDGYPEYAPIAFWGTRSGNSYPPLVGPDSVIYQNNIYRTSGDGTWDIPQGRVMGWKIGTPYLSIVGGQGAVDEPQAISAGGNIIYRNLCCDRKGDWFTMTTPNQSGTLWDYGDTLGSLAPGYDLMWWGVTQYGGYPNVIGGYGGKGTPGSPHNGKNGIYMSHGDQNPIIPYNGLLFAHRSNAIIAYGTGTGPGILPLLQINSVTDIMQTPSLSDLQSRLETEILKILSSWPLRPVYFNVGKSGFSQLNIYFNNPGEILLTLARAYPYLSTPLQAQVKIRLEELFQKYFDPVMYAQIGWADGNPREAMPLPLEVGNSLSQFPKTTWVGYGWSWDYPQLNIYAMWKYAQIFPEDAVIVYDLAKSRLQVPVPEDATDQYLQEFTWEQNAYIAGYIGFLELQELAGRTIEDGQLRTTVTNELNHLQILRATTFSKDTPYVDCTDPQHPECVPINKKFYNRTFNISRNFIWIVPELGEYLNQNALSKVQDAYNDYNYVGPYWFVSRFGATEDEGVVQPIFDYYALFQTKALILKESRQELTKFLDVPAFERGDLYYILNLIAAIEAP